MQVPLDTAENQASLGIKASLYPLILATRDGDASAPYQRSRSLSSVTYRAHPSLRSQLRSNSHPGARDKGTRPVTDLDPRVHVSLNTTCKDTLATFHTPFRLVVYIRQYDRIFICLVDALWVISGVVGMVLCGLAVRVVDLYAGLAYQSAVPWSATKSITSPDTTELATRRPIIRARGRETNRNPTSLPNGPAPSSDPAYYYDHNTYSQPSAYTPGQVYPHLLRVHQESSGYTAQNLPSSPPLSLTSDTIDLDATLANMNLQEEPIGRLTCIICGKTLRRPGVLDDHLNIHLELRPHECDACHRGFAQKGNLTRHKNKCKAVRQSNGAEQSHGTEAGASRALEGSLYPTEYYPYFPPSQGDSGTESGQGSSSANLQWG